MSPGRFITNRMRTETRKLHFFLYWNPLNRNSVWLLFQKIGLTVKITICHHLFHDVKAKLIVWFSEWFIWFPKNKTFYLLSVIFWDIMSKWWMYWHFCLLNIIEVVWQYTELSWNCSELFLVRISPYVELECESAEPSLTVVIWLFCLYGIQGHMIFVIDQYVHLKVIKLSLIIHSLTQLFFGFESFISVQLCLIFKLNYPKLDSNQTNGKF